MKKIFIVLYASVFLSVTLNSCKEDANLSLGTLNPFAAIFVVKNAYKGADLQLSPDNLGGASTTGGIVISDVQNGNVPKGTFVIQNSNRGMTRGLIIELGNVDVPFLPGDSVVVPLTNATLAKVGESLRLRGVSLGNIRKISAGNAQKATTVASNLINANPLAYDGTLITITNATLDPKPVAGDTFAGNKTINDGFGNLTIHTETAATFSGMAVPEGVNVVGIVFGGSGSANSFHQLWPRKGDDIVPLRSLEASPIVVTGYLIDPSGGDANYEYMQFMATEDLNFETTPFSVVTTNNAGSNIPVGFPTNGWATGSQRTYKFDLTTGAVSKGQYFYVGGSTKTINGVGSTDISAAKWIKTIAYNTVTGDGFGDVSTNLLANSGNASGIAIFKTTTVTSTSVPVDVVFWGGNGSIYSAGPPAVGYRITNTDYYDTKHPTTGDDQPFLTTGTNTGSNTVKFGFATANSFAKLGGIYNVTKGRWTVGRTLTNIVLNATTPLTNIETGAGFTTLEQ